MATHASAAKRAKQALKKRDRNRAVLSTMRTAVTKVRTALEKGELADIEALYVSAQSSIARTRRKGIIHVNNMARRIARIRLAINKAKAVPQKAS